MQYEMKEKNAIEIDRISSTFIFRGPQKIQFLKIMHPKLYFQITNIAQM